MPVITLARQLGSGGEAIAARVAQELGARLLDDELLTLAGARAGIPVSILAEMDERGRSLTRHPLDVVRLVPLPPIDPEAPDVLGDRYPPTGPVEARGPGLRSPQYWALEAYATLLARTMRAEAAAGDVVLVGRAGNEALRDVPGVLHVLVVGSAQRRIERLMAVQGLSGYRALDAVRASDRERRDFGRQLWGADWLDPRRYSLCLNSDALSVEPAAALIVAAARSLEGAPAAPAAEAEPVLSGAGAAAGGGG
jgi:Cytidylate kinase-like family